LNPPYEVSKAPSPCTATQQATVVKDANWSEAAPTEHKTTYCSNVLDQVEQTVDAKGNASQATYSPFGDIATSTAAAPGGTEKGGVESLNYDTAGLNLECVVKGISEPQSTCARTNKEALVTSWGYADTNNMFAATEAKNPQEHTTTACYNGSSSSCGEQPPTSGPLGTMKSKTDALAEHNTLKYAYEANGTIKEATDANSHTTKYEYDEKGNLKKITPPTGSKLGATTITVDVNSRPHVITDGAGHKQTLTYDNLDRITKLEYAGTGTAKTVSYEYDANGNITVREDPTGTTKYTSDPLNRLTKEELPGSIVHSYEFDAASNMTSLTDGGGTTTYKYNGLNELESMTEPKTLGTDTFSYDNAHHLTKITYPSGAIENYKVQAATGRPETITAEKVTGTAVPTLSYSYMNGANNTTQIRKLTETPSGAATTYTYDPLERLESAVTKTANLQRYHYTLDPVGNRTEQEVNLSGETGGTITHYAYGAGNELECRQTVAPPCSGSTTTELSHYKYDEAGGLTEITPKHDTAGTTLAYNAASETSSLTPSGESTLALSYGGTGQNDLLTKGTATSLENSLLGITRETNGSGAWCFERTPNGLLIDIRTPTANYNPLYDAQGNIIALVSSTAKVERTFHYGPYGENVKSEGTQTIPFIFGYKGGYRMPGGNKGEGNVANGLYHYGQRYYDPTTGRWTQQDPIDHLGSTTQGNRFLFAGADPINVSDPSGLSGASEFYAYAGGGSGIVAFGCGVAGVATGGAAWVGCGLGAGAISVAIGISAIAEEIF
jgi:RHS repeat-associated protein